MVPEGTFYPEIRAFFPLRVCGECEHFTTKIRPELMAKGIGDCTGYTDGRLRDTTVRWNLRECAHFKWARDMEPRKRWMERCTARDSNNQVKDETKG